MAVCSLLYARFRKPYFFWWAVAWCLYLARLGAILIYVPTGRPFWLYAHQVATGWTALALLWSAVVFSRGSRFRPVVWVAVLLGACVVAAPVGQGERCSHSGCATVCAAGQACAPTCSGGGCTADCQGGSQCSPSCSGGGCTFVCRAGASCAGTCSGGGCRFVCEPGASCANTCTGDGCT